MSVQLTTTQGPAGARLLGLGSFRPERVVTNHELAQQVSTDDEWIRSRVGISERRFASAQDSVVSMAVASGAQALEAAGLAPSDVQAVIVATCTLPSQIPNAAARVADQLGIGAVGAFDVNTACAGFCYGLELATSLIRAASAEHVLVIGSEKLTDWVDPHDRSTCIIFADGAGAAVVGGSAEPMVGPVAWGSAGDIASTIEVADRDSFLRQEGQAVFRWATSTIAPIALEAVKLAGIAPSDVDVFAPHQANLRIVEAIAKKLRSNGARADMRVADDIVTSGNTSSASIPLALAHMRSEGRLAAGEVVLAVGFGAGLSYAGQVLIAP